MDQKAQARPPTEHRFGGQALVEIVVALGIAVLVVVALVALVATSLSNVLFSRTQGQANRYAKEAQAWARGERDKNWTLFSGKVGNTWCMPTLAWPGAGGVCGQSAFIPNTALRRELILTSISATEVDAAARVYWIDNKGSHEVRLNSKLTNWR